jgi:rhodanese-related sulfurtransferase
MQQFLSYASNHAILVAATVIMALVVLVHEFRARTASFGSISPSEAVRMMNSGALLIDIRANDAFAAGHIPNSRSVPGVTIADGAAGLERFKDKPVIAYCDSGQSAGAAARHLGRLGFKQVYNLRGGLAAWRAENLPVEKKG